MKGDKVVYLHRRKSDNKVFYVGIGVKTRPYDFKSRSRFWFNYVNKYGEPNVEIVKDNLTKRDASKLEIELIRKYGRRIKGKGGLVNISKGGECSFGGLEKQVICLKTGCVFDSIKEYAIKNNQHHSTISGFLNRKHKMSTDLYVRFVSNNKITWIPYFDGNESQELVPYVENKGRLVRYKNQQQIDELEERFDDLPLINRALLFMSFTKSYRELSKEIGVSVTSISNRINLSKKIIRGENTNLKRGFYNTCEEKCRYFLKTCDNFYFRNLINQ